MNPLNEFPRSSNCIYQKNVILYEDVTKFGIKTNCLHMSIIVYCIFINFVLTTIDNDIKVSIIKLLSLKQPHQCYRRIQGQLISTERHLHFCNPIPSAVSDVALGSHHFFLRSVNEWSMTRGNANDKKPINVGRNFVLSGEVAEISLLDILDLRKCFPLSLRKTFLKSSLWDWRGTESGASVIPGF